MPAPMHLALITDPQGEKHPCKARLVREKDVDVVIEIDDRQRRRVSPSDAEPDKTWTLRVGPQQFTVHLVNVVAAQAFVYLIEARIGLPPRRRNDDRESTLPKHLR
jgi:hypothetical protein